MAGQGKEKISTNPYSLWNARFWHGMLMKAWFRNLWRNGFRVHPFRIPMATAISLASVFNSSARPLQQLILGASWRRFRSRMHRSSSLAIGVAAQRCCTR